MPASVNVSSPLLTRCEIGGRTLELPTARPDAREHEQRVQMSGLRIGTSPEPLALRRLALGLAELAPRGERRGQRDAGSPTGRRLVDTRFASPPLRLPRRLLGRCRATRARLDQ